MLKFSGFEKAEILKDEEAENRYSVRYYLSSRQDLEDYLQNHAKKMRGEGILKFKDKFSAKRKIFYLQKQKK